MNDTIKIKQHHELNLSPKSNVANRSRDPSDVGIDPCKALFPEIYEYLFCDQ